MSAGPRGDSRSEEDPGRSSALHRPQHHRAGQTQPGVPRPRPGHPTADPRPAAEHPQPEGGAGHPLQGQREAGEEEETEQPQPSELPEEEEEGTADAAAEEEGGARGEEEKKQTEETESWRQHGRPCSS